MDDIQLCSQVGHQEEETAEDWMQGDMEEDVHFGDQSEEDTDWSEHEAVAGENGEYRSKPESKNLVR